MVTLSPRDVLGENVVDEAASSVKNHVWDSSITRAASLSGRLPNKAASAGTVAEDVVN